MEQTWVLPSFWGAETGRHSPSQLWGASATASFNERTPPPWFSLCSQKFAVTTPQSGHWRNQIPQYAKGRPCSLAGLQTHAITCSLSSLSCAGNKLTLSSPLGDINNLGSITRSGGEAACSNTVRQTNSKKPTNQNPKKPFKPNRVG